MQSNHLILCCPLILLPSIFCSIRDFYTRTKHSMTSLPHHPYSSNLLGHHSPLLALSQAHWPPCHSSHKHDVLPAWHLQLHWSQLAKQQTLQPPSSLSSNATFLGKSALMSLFKITSPTPYALNLPPLIRFPPTHILIYCELACELCFLGKSPKYQVNLSIGRDCLTYHCIFST